MSNASDRNLLVGILALQLDFIRRDQLVESLHLWVLHKERSLNEILVEQGALSTDAEPLLLAVVEKHLEMHGQQVERSVAALSTLGTLADELAAFNDPVIDATLPHVGEQRINVTSQLTGTDLSRDRTASGRYTILRAHARGGLGEVSLANDEELHREVAVKLLQQRYAADPNNRVRFVAEAEITGSLEHPGIVPVYGLGTTEDGRPFYAMRFIRGDSLRDAAREFHERTHLSQSDRQLELRKLLGRFVDVCEAISYAHSRGVLHRDLKPGNIMLGRFGETLVVDWGLAKSVGRAESKSKSEEPTIHPSSHSGSTHTQFGSAVGTPAYMSPEQAAGRIDELGPASDVYSLGATLFFVLTGKPPVDEESAALIIERVKKGDVPSPRQVNENVPRALNAICQCAMATRPEERYASPRELAQDIERWLADAVVVAYREPWLETTTRWLRQHSTLVAALAMVAVIAIAAGWGLAWQSEYARRNIAFEKQNVEAARQVAQRNFNRSLDAVDQMLTRVGNERLAEVPFMTDVRRELLEDALAFYQETLSTEEQQLPTVGFQAARSHRLLGRCYQMLGQYEAALREFERDAEILITLDNSPEFTVQFALASIDNHFSHGSLLAMMDEPTQAAQRLRAGVDLFGSLPSGERSQPQALLLRGEIHNSLARAYQSLGQTADALTAYDEAQKSFGQVGDTPGLQEETLNFLQKVAHDRGSFLQNIDQLSKAEQAFGEALEYQRQLQEVVGDKPWYRADHANTLMRLGTTLTQQGRVVEAIRQMEEGRDIFADLNQLYPKIRKYRIQCAASSHNLGEIYLRASRFDAAKAAFRLSIEMLESLRASEEIIEKEVADLANSYMKLAETQANLGEIPKAAESMQASLDTWAQVVKSAPESVLYAIQIAACLHNLARMQEQLGKLDSAESGYRESIRRLKNLSAEASVMSQARGDRANSWMQLASLMMMQGRMEEADSAYRNAQDLFKQLREDYPENMRYALQYPAALHNSAELLEKMDRMSEAAERYQQSIDLLEKCIRQFPLIPQLRRDLASSCYSLAGTLSKLDRQAEAERVIAKSVELIDQVLQGNPDLPDFQFLSAAIHVREALIQGDLPRSVEIARQRAVDAKTPMDRYNAACLHGLCLKSMDRDLDEGPDELSDLLHRRALRLLTECWRENAITPEQVLGDSDLDALHGHADFEELIAKMRTTTP